MKELWLEPTGSPGEGQGHCPREGRDVSACFEGCGGVSQGGKGLDQ